MTRAFKLQEVRLYAEPSHRSALKDMVRVVVLVDSYNLEQSTDDTLVVSDNVNIHISGNEWYSGTWRAGGIEKHAFWESGNIDWGKSRITALIAWRYIEDFMEMIEAKQLVLNKSGQRILIDSVHHLQAYIRTKPSYGSVPKSK